MFSSATGSPDGIGLAGRERISIERLHTSRIEDAARLMHDVWHETQAQLQHPCMAQIRDLAFFLKRVEGRLQTSLVAMSNGACIGYAAWEGNHFASLFILPGSRGAGLGARLCAAVENEMANQGHRDIWLDCICGNVAGRHFYERHGWTCDSIRSWPVECLGVDAAVDAWKMVKTVKS